MALTAFEQRVKDRFQRDVADHEMTVIKDDGLYRHLRFRRPEDTFYSFDIVTWPGYLYIGGDTADYLFSRTRDMFEFFGRDNPGDYINPWYWSEKLQGPRRARDLARSYSHDAFRARMLEWVRQQCEESWDLSDYEIYPSLLTEAVEREVVGWHTDHEEEARSRIQDLADEGIISEEVTLEWDLKEFDHFFIWTCFALSWGIATYRRHREAGKGGGGAWPGRLSLQSS